MVIRLPDCRQETDYDCGAAALKAVFRFWKVAPPDLSPLANDVQGMSPDTVEAVLRGAGLGVLSGNMAVADLAHHTTLGRPVLCPITTAETGHWVVVTRVYRGRVYYHCPELGPTHVPKAAWAAGWEGATRFGHGFFRWGIVPWNADTGGG